MDTSSFSDRKAVPVSAPISAPIRKTEETPEMKRQDVQDLSDIFPVISMPNTEESDSSQNPDGRSINTPVVLLPNPGEGATILPALPSSGTNLGNPNNNILGTIITMFPRPIIPCFFCNTTQYGTVRFLNAAAGYNPFVIYINEQLVVRSLENSEISQYGRVSAGRQIVTVAGQNGYVYIQKSITVKSGSATTVAIINTASGLDILEISDSACYASAGNGCLRACNLSSTNPSINVTLNRGYLTFRNVRYKEVTNFAYLPSGNYNIQVANSNSSMTLVSSSIFVRSNASYTIYVFNWSLYADSIRILVVEDRRQ